MHLSTSQGKRFAKLFYSLLSFVDEKYDPMEELVELAGPDNPFDSDYFTPLVITEICSFLFNAQGRGRKEGAIDAFLKANPDALPAEDLVQIAQWKDAFNGAFFTIESSPESTILMGNGSLFSVTAVTRDACELLGDAPAMTIATLLPFDGLIVLVGCMPGYPLDQSSGLQEKILLQGRKLRTAGHLCTTAEELIREAPLLRARNSKDHDETLDQAVADLILKTLEMLREEKGKEGDPLFDPWDEYEDECDFDDFDLFEDLDYDPFEDEPVPTHVGVLAGLTPEERSAAVEAQLGVDFYQLMDDFQCWAEGGVYRHAPVRTLRETLALETKRSLYEAARRLGCSRYSKLNKAQLVELLEQRFTEMSIGAAGSFAGSVFNGMLEQAKRVWSAGGMVEMSLKEHGTLPIAERLHAFFPLMNVFEQGGTVSCVIPNEVMAALNEDCWEQARAKEKQLGHARHLADVYVTLCGIVTEEDLVKLYQRYYPAELSEAEFRGLLHHGGPDRFNGFDLWTYGGECHLIHVALLSRDELLNSRVTGARINGDRMRRVTDAEEQRRYVLDCHEDVEPWEVPSRTAEELEAFRPYNAIVSTPSHRALQEFLDAHVPEGQDDRFWADKLIETLVMMARLGCDDADYAIELSQQGLFLDRGAELYQLLELVIAFVMDVPCWLENGWSPNAFAEFEEE